MPMDHDEVATCLAVLARLDDPELDSADRQRLERAVTAAAREIKRRAKSRRSTESRNADRALLATATRFHTELPDPAPVEPAAPDQPAGAAAGTLAGDVSQQRLRRARHCYVCKAGYREVDADYHLMCAACAGHNRSQRYARIDLTGHSAVVTGGRVKIGFHTALKLLRDGAEVAVTTRFPRDAARRYAAMPDFADWADRLTVHGLDLLDLPAVLDFVELTRQRPGGLDILVNNAAQTLYRPGAYHREVRAAEDAPLLGPATRLTVHASRKRAPALRDPLAPTTHTAPHLTALETSPTAAHDASLTAAHNASHLKAHKTAPAVAHEALFAAAREASHLAAHDALFPATLTDETGQQLDLRATNSWVLRDADVSPQEWLQVHVVNAFAPFLLTSRLRPLLAASPHARRHVVQVSAMEGSFSRSAKTFRHPHTNMAKASLNMLVRTVAADYARDGILMNAVDTGWVTDERPHPSKQAQRSLGFRPPLDVIDGAARVYHPIVAAERGEPLIGQFLKDYRSVPW